MRKPATPSKRTIWALIATVVTTLAVALPQAVAWLPIHEILGANGRVMTHSVRSVTVQGWGFFTKSPRGISYRVYKLESDDSGRDYWSSASKAPNNQPQNWFGLDRSSRLQEFDVAALTSTLNDTDWTHCENTAEVMTCAEYANIKNIPSLQGSFTLDGRYLVTRAKPVPWSYRSLRSGMPGEVVIVNVTN